MTNNKLTTESNLAINSNDIQNTNLAFYVNTNSKTENSTNENSTLRKFIRKSTQRLNKAKIVNNILNADNKNLRNSADLQKIYSKRWKIIFSKLSNPSLNKKTGFMSMTTDVLLNEKNFKNNYISLTNEQGYLLKNRELETKNRFGENNFLISKLKQDSKLNLINRLNSETNLSKKDRQILNYRSFIASNIEKNRYKPLTLLHPIKFYLQKDKVYFQPLPQTIRTIRYYYTYRIADVTLESETPDIPPQYHEYLANLIAMKCFLKDGRDPGFILNEVNETNN